MKAPLRSADTAPAEPPSSFTASLLAYNLALLLVALILAPFAAIACLAKPRWRESLGSRLGLGWPRPAGSPVLWAHAASVGEID